MRDCWERMGFGIHVEEEENRAVILGRLRSVHLLHGGEMKHIALIIKSLV